MTDRHKAIVGAVTLWVAKRMAQRKLASAQDAVVPDGGGWQMLNRTKSAPMAVAERATTFVEAVRPVVQRAMTDPELHAAVRQAFDTGREVTVQVKGRPPRKVAERLARDRKLQKRVERSADDLKAAVTAVLAEPKKQKGFFRKVITPVAVIGGVAAGVFVLLRKRSGGDQETPY